MCFYILLIRQCSYYTNGYSKGVLCPSYNRNSYNMNVFSLNTSQVTSVCLLTCETGSPFTNHSVLRSCVDQRKMEPPQNQDQVNTYDQAHFCLRPKPNSPPKSTQLQGTEKGKHHHEHVTYEIILRSNNVLSFPLLSNRNNRVLTYITVTKHT